MLDKIKKGFENLNIQISDYMVFVNKRPHTASVAHLSSCCIGRDTAEYYFLAKYFDKIDQSMADGMIGELKKLQNTDKDSEFYGCMRWYREEAFIADTNAAFFSLLPVAFAFKYCRDKMSDYEKDTIKELLNTGSAWFLKECKGPLFYTNKVISDGAMLTLISRLIGKYEAEAEEFWHRWIDYTDRRGWGWGEDLSNDYSTVCITALNASILSIKNDEIKETLIKKRDELLEYISFHGRRYIIPGIRGYNFMGDTRFGGEHLYRMLYNPENLTIADLVSSLMYYKAEVKNVNLEKDIKNETKIRRIFDDSYAYTWIGDKVRLGTVSKFPVMPNCYQGEHGGLGWQSMPVCAMIEDKSVSFLKLRAITNKNMHSHPSEDFNSAYLFNRVFEDEHIPKFDIRSAQNENIAIAVRQIRHLANYAEAIYDEWCIPGNEDIKKISLNGYDWYITESNNRAVAVCPLDTVKVMGGKREKPEIKVIKTENFTNISNVLYEGEEKLNVCKYVESVWVIVALNSAKNCREYLSSIMIQDDLMQEMDIPRYDDGKKRQIKCTDGKKTVEIEIDPYV